MLRRRPTHHLGDRMHQARRAGLDQVIREAEVPDSQLSRARVAPADSPANGRRATCRGTPHLEGGLGERRNVSNWRQVLICNLDSKPIDVAPIHRSEGWVGGCRGLRCRRRLGRLGDGLMAASKQGFGAGLGC